MDLTFYLPQTVSDAITNGGLRSEISFFTSYKNNILPDITKNNVINGLTRYRKFFCIYPDDLIYLRAYLAYPSLAMDNVLIRQGTLTDTQDEADDYTGWKGSGTLKNSLTVGEITSMVVTSENEGEGYNVGDLICLQGESEDDFIRSTGVTWDGYDATLSFASGTTIRQDYNAEACVSSIIERGAGNEYAFWIKETVPLDIASFINNVSRINFLYRSF
jgi:hypothetical protein